MVLQAILWDHRQKTLRILNQLILPHTEEYDQINNVEDAWHAIKEMRVRGAPAIAIVAALSLAADLVKDTPSANVANTIGQKLDYLETSRPTAVNLADAVRKLKKIIASAEEKGASGQDLVELYVKSAEQMLVDDVKDNEAIGRHGAEWIEHSARGIADDGLSVITHCNTGSLATAGYGTALGVVRSLHANKSLLHAYCTETRPYNQGSRLTAFELVHDSIPATLITDSMAGALLARNSRIAAIIVGADRVAANGDTANKIGTYGLAVLARHHGVKFLVAAPRTTIDLSTASGADITIEERKSVEVTTIRGPVADPHTGKPNLDRSETIVVAANGIGVWNPAFDVTPADLIDGIVTEVGVFEKGADRKYHLDEAFQR